MLKAVRGAIQVSCDNEDLIGEKTNELISTIIHENGIDQMDIVSIQFTQTSDLLSLNCAAGLRRYGFDRIPLFCAQEPACKDAMPRVIRTLVTCYVGRRKEVKHIYLGGAEQLRPDLAG